MGDLEKFLCTFGVGKILCRWTSGIWSQGWESPRWRAAQNRRRSP